MTKMVGDLNTTAILIAFATAVQDIQANSYEFAPIVGFQKISFMGHTSLSD